MKFPSRTCTEGRKYFRDRTSFEREASALVDLLLRKKGRVVFVSRVCRQYSKQNGKQSDGCVTRLLL